MSDPRSNESRLGRIESVLFNLSVHLGLNPNTREKTQSGVSTAEVVMPTQVPPSYSEPGDFVNSIESRLRRIETVLCVLSFYLGINPRTREVVPKGTIVPRVRPAVMKEGGQDAS